MARARGGYRSFGDCELPSCTESNSAWVTWTTFQIMRGDIAVRKKWPFWHKCTHTHTHTYDRVHADISICASLTLLACRARLRDSYEYFALKKLPVRSKRPNYSCQAVVCHFRRCRDHRLSHRDVVPARPKSCGFMKNARRTLATACVPPHPTPCWDSAEKQALDEGILAACHRNTLWWVITYHTHTPPYFLARDACLEPIIQCYVCPSSLGLGFGQGRNSHRF